MTDTDGMSNIAEDKQRMEIAKKAFQEVLKQYLVGGNPMYRSDGKQNELELRFGTNTYSGRIMTKINYDNVVK